MTSALAHPSHLALLALLYEAASLGVGQLLQWPYGPAGIAGLTLLAVGLSTRRPAYSSAGALVLTLVVLAPSH